MTIKKNTGAALEETPCPRHCSGQDRFKQTARISHLAKDFTIRSHSHIHSHTNRGYCHAERGFGVLPTDTAYEEGVGFELPVLGQPALPTES